MINKLPDWLRVLNEEDLSFIRRLVLASGSLKAIAEEYGISYPTVRLRLDRLIAKIQAADSARDATDFELILRGAYAEGKLDKETMKQLLAAHNKEAGRGGR